MKKWTLLLCALLLSGCKVDHVKIQDGITNELIEMTENEPIYYTTMEKPLYSYYLPKDIGRISSNELSSLFVKDGVKFIMNFNPNRSNIVGIFIILFYANVRYNIISCKYYTLNMV